MRQDLAISSPPLGRANPQAVESSSKTLAPDVEVAPDQIAVGVIVGRMSEYFDFFVYAIASVLVFPQLFFPMVDRLDGSLFSFGIFSLAFLVRPIGAVLFTAIDERHGRVVKLTIALFLLGTSTVAISFLPGYGLLGGAAIFLLALCRIGQGLALAGTWDGMASLLAMNAPANRRGWYAMMPQLGAPLGFLLAAGLFAYLVSNLTPTEFVEWGWRYPFIVAMAVNVVALFARLRLVSTEQFASLFERSELEPVPVARLLKFEGRNVLIGAFAPVASFAMFHLVSVFPLSWVTLFTPQHAAKFLVVEMVAAGVGMLGVAVSGISADRFNRRYHLAVCAILIGIFGLLAPQLLATGPAGEAAFLIIGFALLGLSFGQSSGAVSSNFSREYRYTGAAFTSDLAWLIGAGFAPLVALSLASRFGLEAVGLYLVSAAICTVAALVINRRLQRENNAVG